MASTTLFVAMVIFAAILLFTVSLTCSVGASDILSSTFYNTDNKARSAHQYLVIAAALGWASLIVLIIIMIIAVFAGGFSTVEVSQTLLTAPNPTRNDLLAVYQADKEISAGYTTQLMLLIVLIMITIVTFVTAILAILAAVDIINMRQRDNKANSARTAAIIGSISGVASFIFMVITVIAYVGIRSGYIQQVRDLGMFEKRAELQLVGTSPQTPTPITIIR